MAEQSNQNNNTGGGGGSSSFVSYSAATSITSAGTYSNQTYTSTTDAENAVLVSLSSGTVNLVNPTVNKSGGPTNAGDNYNFYGINSGVMAMGGGTVSITGGTITTTGVGANSVFSYGGNDQIRNAADGDVINLGDITLDDNSSTLIMNAGVKLDFKDVGSLMLANVANVTFKLADGSSYRADYDSHSWKAND